MEIWNVGIILKNLLKFKNRKSAYSTQKVRYFNNLLK